MDINPETLLKLLENASVGGNPELQREANEILLRLQSSVDTYIPLLVITITHQNWIQIDLRDSKIYRE